jgi:hypothetical protein
MVDWNGVGSQAKNATGVPEEEVLTVTVSHSPAENHIGAIREESRGLLDV